MRGSISAKHSIARRGGESERLVKLTTPLSFRAQLKTSTQGKRILIVRAKRLLL